MQETIQQISDQITDKWNNLTKQRKVQIGLGVIICVGLLILIVFLSRPKYKILFSENVDAKTVAQVAAVLDEQSIKYRLINESTNIEVQDSHYQQALMYTAASGTMEEGMTLEELLTNDMSTTTQQYNTKTKEYSKQTLQETLKMIDGIEKARVELVIPEEKNAYLQSQMKGSASVFLTLSKPLTSQQCEGIATYVASGVQNLEKEHIVIIDSTGETLYSGEQENLAALGKQQELKSSAEYQVKSKVVELLDNMYDDIRISPNLVLDWDQYQENNTKYETQGEDEVRGIVSSEVEAKSTTTNSTAGGEPGTGSNGGDIPTYQSIQSGDQSSKDTQSEINYLPNKQESIYVKNIGEVDLEKSTLSVNLSNNKIYKEEDIVPTLTTLSWYEFKQQNKQPIPLPVDTSIVELISNATGIQNVVVSAYENPIFLDAEKYVIDYKDFIPYIVLIALLILVAFVILKFRKQDSTVEVEPELEIEEMLKTAKEQVETDEIDMRENLESKRQIDKFVDEKPEAVANLLKNWLTDEDWE